MPLQEHNLSQADIDNFLGKLLTQYGFDFNEYTRASLNRRIIRVFEKDGFKDLGSFENRILNNNVYFRYFVEELTVNVTEMFRDPPFILALREKVLPILATYPHIRIWCAGCSTGEEVYSLAILLHECNLLHKSLLYATDLNPQVLVKARQGIYPLVAMREASQNYHASGGKEDFSNYYTAKYDYAMFDKQLCSNMIFSTHNLASDSSFNEFQLILCRNVMIYFQKPLQNKVLTLFDSSLERLCFLALGSKETIRFSDIESLYSLFNPEKIWRKN